MAKLRPVLALLLTVLALALLVTGADARARKSALAFAIARVYFEYNATANDLGVHVFLDGEDWRELEIVNPAGRTIFEVEGKGPYRDLGMTELFFEGAEPNLDDVPLAELLGRFPAGRYRLVGRTVGGEPIRGTAMLSHAIPAGPTVAAALTLPDRLVISWEAVTAPPPGFPDEPITIVAYQVIVGAFQVTVPAGQLSLTVSPEFVASLAPGSHQFEVLAIEAGGNQTITEGSFTKP